MWELRIFRDRKILMAQTEKFLKIHLVPAETFIYHARFWADVTH